jgi:hypothetical protein
MLAGDNNFPPGAGASTRSDINATEQKIGSNSEIAPARMRCARPNAMTFTDDEGVTRQIFIHRDSYELCMKLYRENNWKELAKFPVYSKVSIEEVVLTMQAVNSILRKITTILIFKKAMS